MKEAKDRTVKEIEETRDRLTENIHAVEDLLPAKEQTKRSTMVTVGGTAAGLMSLVAARAFTSRHKRKREDEVLAENGLEPRAQSHRVRAFLGGVGVGAAALRLIERRIATKR